MKKLVFLLVLPFLCCKSPVEKKSIPGADTKEELVEMIDSLFQSKIEAGGPGAAVLIAFEGEKLIGKGFGLGNIEETSPVTSSTNMRMASVSKQFTALCILELAERGMLSLDDPVSKFWPYPVFEGITVEQLINHTSGLADYESAFLEEWDRSEIVENADVLDWLKTNPEPLFPPGSQWEYSNTAYLVLALLVEKVSEIPFAVFAKDKVFKPAGMDGSTFYNLADPVDINQRAFCYEKDSTGNWSRADGYFMNGVMGDGALYTSIDDFFNYDNALRNNEILGVEMHAKIFTPSSMAIPEDGGLSSFISEFSFWDNEAIYYATGWFINGDIAFHTGSWNGTRTFVVHELGRPLTVAVFLNSDSAEIRNELLDQTYDLADQYIKKTK